MRRHHLGVIAVLASRWALCCLTGVLLENATLTQLQSSLTSSLTVTCLWGWRVSGLSAHCCKVSGSALKRQHKVELLCVSHRPSISESVCVCKQERQEQLNTDCPYPDAPLVIIGRPCDILSEWPWDEFHNELPMLIPSLKCPTQVLLWLVHHGRSARVSRGFRTLLR